MPIFASLPEIPLGWLSLLNGRELALLSWLAFLAMVLFVWHKTRSDVLQLVRLSLHWKLLVPALLLVAIVVGASFAVDSLGLWRQEMAVDGFFWLGATGLVTYSRSATISKDPLFFRHITVEAFSLSAVVEFISNLFTFNYWVEFFVVLPVLVTLAAFEAVAVLEARKRVDRSSRIVAGCATTALSLVGLFVLVRSVWSFVLEWHELDLWSLARSLLWPAVLSLVTIPFFFALGLVATYEATFVRLRIWAPGRRLPHHVILGVLVGFNIRIWSLRRLVGLWHDLIANSGTFDECRATVRSLRMTPAGSELETAYRIKYGASPDDG